MPDNLTPNPSGLPAGGGAAPAGEGQPQPGGDIPTPSVYRDLQGKKGFKNEEDLAKSYVEAEQSLGRHQNVNNKIKQQLESAGYTMDEDGNIKPASGGMPPAPNAGVAQDIVYDPYTGMPLTDPIALQLARMPVGQREVFIFNAMQEQREKNQGLAFQADQEILSRPEAKGFEDDVRKVMQTLPLAQRADKKEWERALLQVKGARYDADKRNWAQNGVDDFVNKENLQNPGGTGGGGGGAEGRLTTEQETSFRWYQQNQPGMFKDRAHFARALSPTGGR